MTARQKIRVGIIGVNPRQGWAMRAHIPALRALPDYEITAVGTSRIESARVAADHFGVPHAFADPRELAEHPEVDLVVVTVKVPAHLELVEAALAAGKHVLCEWPLTRTTAQAERLTAAAAVAGVHHAVGLQARYAPALGYARELIADGYLGEIGSATLYEARAKGAGETMPAWMAYTLDRANGAGTLEVAGGHTLDAVQHLLGGIERLSATLAVRRGSYRIAETGEPVEVNSPDQLLLNATLAGGAVLSAHIHDGKGVEPRTRLEISGSKGDLALVSAGPGAPMGIQVGELRLLGARGVGGSLAELPIPAKYFTVDPASVGDQGHHVAQQYAQFAADLRSGERTVPDFAAGLRLHRLLDAVRRSDATGTRQVV
ncbi:Gfo/Idh/MocA family oxidoreductase [Kitasatospora sp. GAS204B]|uniref:Gfo/Idh/MocA family protein n=1 Tax=unclassified Kitasatospora TaxID=2633591 RepID=UPI0024752561|nr:Gfo/Idh/MocA family oxidoreductase [Kitasatospora sp. GAS204B]MDH6121174.1 putative dehydrogenase [Kitasatospora sp. GAS204B]